MFDTDSEKSYGLFVGIQNFEGKSDFAEVPFAVDDAIDLAWYFSLESHFIASSRVKLVLSGEPRKTETQERLLRMRQAGTADEIPATFINVSRELERAGNEADEGGVLVITFASHGFRTNTDRIVCFDTLLRQLSDTTVPVEKVLDFASRAVAQKRLVLLDVCRERLYAHRGIGPIDPGTSVTQDYRMSEEAGQLIAETRGMAVLFATKPGSFSYDDPQSSNGLFTAQFLAGVKEEAPANDKGFVTIQTISRYLDEEVKTWVRKYRPDHDADNAGISCNIDDTSSFNMCLAERERPVGKECIILHAMHRDRERRGHVTGDVIDAVIAPACKAAGYAIKRVKLLLDASMSELQYSQMVVTYVGAGDWDTEILAKIGFRLASGRPLVWIQECDFNIPLALKTVLADRHIQFVILNESEDVKSQIVNAIREQEGHFWGAKPEHPTAVLMVERVYGEVDREQYIAADKRAAELLSGEPDPSRVIGDQGAKVVEHLKKTCLPAQWPYMEREQNQLYEDLLDNSPVQGDQVPVARFPHVFRPVGGTKEDITAVIPVITRRAHRDSRRYLEIMHFDVTDWVSQYADGHYELVPSTGRKGISELFFATNRTHFSPQPTMSIGPDGGIAELNVAMEVLLGENRNQLLQVNLQEFCQRFIEDPHDVEPSMLRILDTKKSHTAPLLERQTFNVRTEKFGWARCRALATPIIDVIDGCTGGADWHWYLEAAGKRQRYNQILQATIESELLWEIYAASHDHVLPVLDYYKETTARHVAAMNATGKRILDVGAGTGNVTVQLLEKGKTVTAIDTSRSMLNHLQSKLAGQFSKQLEVIQQSAENLTMLKNDEFDGVTAMLSLYVMPEKEGALKECIRVLCPGGTIVITDPKKNIKRGFTILREKALMNLEELQPSEELIMHANVVDNMGAKLSQVANTNPDIEQIYVILERAGFEGLSITDSHYGACATVLGKKPG